MARQLESVGETEIPSDMIGELVMEALSTLDQVAYIRFASSTPRTNGKAERFIQTALREWAYAQAYPTSEHRRAALPAWLHRYNWHRPHGSLKSATPISRLGLSDDDLLRLHS